MNYKKILWLLLLLLPAGAVIRIMQYYYAIDPVSGYFKQDDKTIFIMYGFIGICFLVFSLPLLKGKKDKSVLDEDLPKNNVLENLLVSVTSAIYIAYAISYVFSVFRNETDIELNGLFLLIFAILSAVFFGMCVASDENILKNVIFKFVALSPIVLFLIRLVTVFNQLTMEANVSGYTLELIELASFVFFFMNFAKYTHSKNNLRSLFIFGLWSVLSVFIASVPAILLRFLPGNVFRQEQPLPLELLYFFTGLFILNIVIKIGSLKERK